MKKETIHNFIVNIVAVAFCIVYLMPVIIMISSSLKTDTEIFQYPGRLFSHQPNVETYSTIFSGNYNVANSFKNSVIIAAGAMLISSVIAIPAAYSLARFKIKGHVFMMFIFLISQMLPPTLTLTPLFLMFRKIGLTNNLLAPILASASTSIPFAIITQRTYFMTLPSGLEVSVKSCACRKSNAAFQRRLEWQLSGSSFDQGSNLSSSATGAASMVPYFLRSSGSTVRR